MVGTVGPHKNLITLVEDMKVLRERGNSPFSFCWRPPIAVPTPEEAFALILEDQARDVPETVAHAL